MWKTTSTLIGIILILLTLGIIMLASTSAVHGQTHYNDAHYFLKKQLMWLGAALIVGVIMARIDYRLWKHAAVPLAVISVFLLVIVLIPAIGHKIGGSRRWLRVGPVNVQPSELAKISVMVLLAWWMSKIQRRADDFIKGLLIPLACLGAILLLIFAEPDYGTTLLVAVVGMLMMFVAGTRISYLAVAALIGALGFVLAVMQNPVRLKRIIAFLNPEKYAQEEAFQLLNAIYAFVMGGGTGVGLGESIQKRFYLPEAHTDFIFAIIGEELGMLGSLSIVGLFLGLFVCGLVISLNASDSFGRLLGFGATMMIILQAAINIGVVTGCLPTKGLPLPFISFGGSSLVISMVTVGMLISIGTHQDKSFIS